jgi:hypothetical protein
VRRILIVDDEQRVLAGLRRQLHALRREWELLFLDSAEAALAELSCRPADVIVTDMRMPGMDARSSWTWPRPRASYASGRRSRSRLSRRGRCHRYLSSPPGRAARGAICQARCARGARREGARL